MFVSIRSEPVHKRFRPVSFSLKLVTKLQLSVNDPVVVYLDGRNLKFKVRPTKKDELAAAHRLRPDSGAGSLLILAAGLPEPSCSMGRYSALVDGEWITINLDEHKPAVTPAAPKRR